MKPALFELSTDARFIRQRLHGMKPGDTVSYTDLATIIGKSVTGSLSALKTAKRGLLKEGYVFSPIRGEGLRRLTDAEVVGAADSDIAMIRRKARKTGAKLSTVSYEKLPAPKQLAHTAKASIVGAVAAITTNKAMTKIESAVGGRSGELPISETMKALGYNV